MMTNSEMTEQITTSDFRVWLREKRACSEAREWLGDRTAAEAWEQCERADWLLWWAATAKVDRKIVVSVACQCARRALRFVPAVELRPERAIETAEAWTRDEASIADVRAASSSSASYASSAAAAADAYASSASYASSAAAAASSAAAYAADAADAADAETRHQEHLAMCAIVREAIPFEAVWHG